MSAVIDAKAYKRIKSYIEYARLEEGAKIIFGGDCDDSKGYFIQPTCIYVDNFDSKLMVEVYLNFIIY